MFLLFIVFLAVSTYLSYKRTVYGCACLLVSRILIPECVRLTPFLDVSLNTAVILILVFFAFRDIFTIKNISIRISKDKYVRYLLFFISYFFISLPFSDYSNLSYQYSRTVQFFVTDILPVIIFIQSIRNKYDLLLILKVLSVCTFICCVYGCLTIIVGDNPYVAIIKSLYRDDETSTNEFLLYDERGYMSTSATFVHSNGWGYFLPITFVLFYLLYAKNFFSKKIIIPLLVLLSIGVVICSKRSAFVAYFSFWLFYFLYSSLIKKVRFVYCFIFFCILGYLCLLFIPQLNNIRGMVESSLFFWNDSVAAKNDIGGSNFVMRVNQVLYSFVEIQNNLLFGHGFGWSSYYLQRNPFHPILYGFEIIISDALVNGGILGLLLWFYTFYFSCKYSLLNIKCKKDRKYAIILTLVQFVIALATGLSYFIFYGVYIVLLHKFFQFNMFSNENINRNSNIQLQGFGGRNN